MMSISKASIAIRKSNRIGKAAAVYACNGQSLHRVDYASVKEARAAAADLKKKTGWPLDEDLTREASFDQKSPARGGDTGGQLHSNRPK